MAQQWFYASNGGQAGPVDDDDLKRLVASGELQPTDLVWRDGLSDWMPASNVKALFPAAFAEAAAARQSEVVPAAQPAEAQVAPPVGAYAQPYTPAPDQPMAVLPYQGGGNVVVGVSARSLQALRRTRPWVIFFSVLGFIVTGLCLISAAFSLIAGTMSRGAGVFAVLGLLFYGLAAALNFFPAWYLWRFGSRISRLAARGQVDDLDAALEAQRAFWQMTGIIALVVVSLYALLAVIMIVGYSWFR